MLIIRKEQLKALQEALIGPYIDSMISYLRSEVEEVVLDASDDELRDFIRHGVNRAAEYAIQDPYLVQQYILFMAWVGKDFDTDPKTSWAAEILNDAEIGAEDKIGELEDYIMSEWEGSK